ncbi:MAG: hypothetical protein IKS43_01725 [Clostridia bacterium]|nr:hypothetical protein [Clostridia bacterium]
MKRFVFAAAAVLLAASLSFTACRGKHGAPGPTGAPAGATQTPAPTTADGSNYDNTAEFSNGTLSGGSFNWQYFVGKTGANRPAHITLHSVDEGVSKDYDISFVPGTFTVTEGANTYEYTSLISFTADFAEGEYTMAEISVLTDDPNITAETFFGGTVPQDARIGDVTDYGMVVFINYK